MLLEQRLQSVHEKTYGCQVMKKRENLTEMNNQVSTTMFNEFLQAQEYDLDLLPYLQHDIYIRLLVILWYIRLFGIYENKDWLKGGEN